MDDTGWVGEVVPVFGYDEKGRNDFFGYVIHLWIVYKSIIIQSEIFYIFCFFINDNTIQFHK